MKDKKIIASAVVLAAIIIGASWYFSKHGTPPASILSPSPTPVLEKGIVFGNPDAPVTIEEYTNFLCPACARFGSVTFEQIKEDYVKSGKVKFVIYVYPPQELSKAALCAQEQDKFASFHDYFFAHQSELASEADVFIFAVNAGLDDAAFRSCYNSTKYDEKTTKWFSEGEARGVDSTPTFFINGQKFIGAQPYEEFKKIIDQKLGV